jgi:hypothetical protein
MWLIVGKSTKVQRIEGGREVQRRCEKCEKVTTFAECNMKDSMQVFFVSLLDFKTRRMVCMTCGDDFDVDELARTPASSRAAASTNAPAPPPKRSSPNDPEIDDELAALKRRIGK